MPFSQNCGLIHQLCPLDSRGGQPNPCLPLALICHHIKPVSQQKPWRWPAIKILIWYLLLSPLDMQKYPHRCFSLSHRHKWMFWWVHTGLQMCPCAHTHTCTEQVGIYDSLSDETKAWKWVPQIVSLWHFGFSVCKDDVSVLFTLLSLRIIFKGEHHWHIIQSAKQCPHLIYGGFKRGEWNSLRLNPCSDMTLEVLVLLLLALSVFVFFPPSSWLCLNRSLILMLLLHVCSLSLVVFSVQSKPPLIILCYSACFCFRLQRVC